MNFPFHLIQGAEAITRLETQCALPVVVQVRTKKRYFVPPSAQAKSMSQGEQEARARAAGIVPRQEYMERPINISCTGRLYSRHIVERLLRPNIYLRSVILRTFNVFLVFILCLCYPSECLCYVMLVEAQTFWEKY